MAGSLGDLYFNISAKTTNLTKSINEAKKTLKEFDSLGKRVSNNTTKTMRQVAKETGKTVSQVRSELMKLAAEYKKQGFDKSTATKKAYTSMGIGKDTLAENVKGILGKDTSIFNIPGSQTGGRISELSDKFSKLSTILGESGEYTSLAGKLGNVSSALGKVGAVASKAGPIVMAVVEALKVLGKIAKPFIKAYIKILTGVVKTTGSIALKIGQSLINGLISPLKKGFNNIINPFGRTYGNKLGMLIGGGLAAGLTYKLKNFVKDLINSGGEFEQMTQGIQILFADTRTSTENSYEAINAASDKMRQKAMMAYKDVGMNANEYMNMASGYATRIISELSGDTDKAAEVINTAMQDMSDNWHLLGGDFELIKNAYESLLRGNYRTFDNLKLGYGQTKTEVQRLLKDAEKLSGVHYDIDNLSDIMLAIHEIQKATGMTGTTAREALTTWAGATNMLRNAWMNFKATVGQGLIYILRPVLQIIAKISDALVAAGMRFMAWAQKITGIKDMVVGKKNNKDYSSAATGIGGINDALDGVGGSAGKVKKAVKDLKRELMGFDQINKLTGEKGTDTDSGTSGGSGTGTGVDLDDLVDQSWMNRMVESAGEDLVTFYEQKIKEAWENADFTIIGWNVAEKIAGALEKINWDKIKDVCGKIGKSLATFLNGIIMDGRLWIDVGNSFAEAINSVVNAGYEFVKNFYWTGLGESLALGINAAIFKIDTTKIGLLISERIKGGLDYSIALIGNIDFTQIADKISNLLFNIDFPTIKQKAGQLGETIATALNDIFSNARLSRQAGESFGNTIDTIINYGYNAVTTFSWGTFGSAISNFLYNTFDNIDAKKVGQTVYSTIHGIFTTLKTILEDEETWKQIEKSIDDALDEIDFGQLIADAFEISGLVAKRLWEIGKIVAGHVLQGFIDYMWKEHPIIMSILDPAGATLKIRLKGEKDPSFTEVERGLYNFQDKTAVATGKGNQTPTLGALLGNWFKVNTKTETVTGKGITTAGLGGLLTNWKGINNKNATVTASGKKAPKFDSTKKSYDSVKDKNAKVTVSLKTIAKEAWNSVARKFNELKRNHPIIMKAFPKLPYLAQGGFVKRNTPQLAVIGDNRREGEIVAPESKLAAMAAQAAGSSNDETNALLRQLIGLVASMNLNIELDGEAIKNNTVRRINNHTRSTGQLEILI